MALVHDWTRAKYLSNDDSDHGRAIDALASLLETEASTTVTAKTITMAQEVLQATSSPTTNDIPNHVSAFWALYMCEAIRAFGGAQ